MILLGGRISFCVNALTQQHYPCSTLSLSLLRLTSLQSRDSLEISVSVTVTMTQQSSLGLHLLLLVIVST